MASSVLNENVQKRKLCFIVTVRIYVAYILYSIYTLSSLISLLHRPAFLQRWDRRRAVQTVMLFYYFLPNRFEY